MKLQSNKIERIYKNQIERKIFELLTRAYLLYNQQWNAAKLCYDSAP